MRLKIVTVPILPFGMLNAYLLIGDGRAILVDTGLPRSGKMIHNVLASERLKKTDIVLIIITHGHIDHAGDAAYWREICGAPILLHHREAGYCNGSEEYIFKPSRLFGTLFLKTGLMTRAYPHFEPDITMWDEAFSLHAYGFDATVHHTPGHTPGSLSIILSDGRAIVGDLLASGILLGGIIRRHVPQSPPFEDQRHIVATEIFRLAAMHVTSFYPGHGFAVSQDAAVRHAKRLANA